MRSRAQRLDQQIRVVKHAKPAMLLGWRERGVAVVIEANEYVGADFANSVNECRAPFS